MVTVHPITATDLAMILKDNKVVQRMAEVNATMCQELGFVVVYNAAEDSYVVSAIQYGQENKIVEFDPRAGIPAGFKGVPLLTYHTHDDDDIIIPSGFEEGGDLQAWYEWREMDRIDYGIDIRALHAITINENIPKAPWNILLVQEQSVEQAPRAEMKKQVEVLLNDEFLYGATQRQVVQRLRKTGLYHGELVQLHFDQGKGRYFPESELEKLARFDCTPRIVDEARFKKWYGVVEQQAAY